MADALIDALVSRGGQLFGKRSSLMSLWQHLAEQFYVERADFTTVRNIGAEMAEGLTTSYPLIVRRDLGNAFAAMLRPTEKDWFKIGTNRPDREDTEAKQWLEWVGKLQKRAMYDRVAQFTRATKEGDHDFATFGQCCISTELTADKAALLYRCWHLRDVAWAEDHTGKVTTIHRRWKPTALELRTLFPKTIHKETLEKLKTDPYHEANVQHIVMPAEQYADLPGAKPMRTPFVSLYIDIDHHHELECTGSWTKIYTIPRWQTVSGSQYAYSPAATAALPDARLLQAVSLTLLEAGEKATNPPMIAVQEAIRGDVSVYAGGITWVSQEYDERLGEVLRALTQDKSGLAFGLDTQQDLRGQLADAWFLSKLNLPPTGGPDMTAYEVGQRVQEYIRNTLPLFEPMESDYNGSLCEDTFELILRNSPEVAQSVPESIQGADIMFSFESPLHDAIEKVKIGMFLEAQQILATAIQLDPAAANIVDGPKATRDVLGVTIPAAWMRSQEDADKITAAQAEAAATQQQLQTMQQGADVAKTLADTGMVNPQGGM